MKLARHQVYTVHIRSSAFEAFSLSLSLLSAWMDGTMWRGVASCLGIGLGVAR